MQAKDQRSADVEYFDPRITSGHRYCLVWISLVNCLYVQQALPKSTNLHLRSTDASSFCLIDRLPLLLPWSFNFVPSASDNLLVPAELEARSLAELALGDDSTAPEVSGLPSTPSEASFSKQPWAACLAFLLIFFLWFLTKSPFNIFVSFTPVDSSTILSLLLGRISCAPDFLGSLDGSIIDKSRMFSGFKSVCMMESCLCK